MLNQLAADGSISLKTYGKQQVFVARQDEIEVPSQDEIDRMDDQIVELKEQLAELQAQTKEAAASMSPALSWPPLTRAQPSASCGHR